MFEKVNPCHPDKVADRIAGALVDAAYRKEENPRRDTPELVNKDAYENWIIKVELTNKEELNELMDAEAYKNFCEK